MKCANCEALRDTVRRLERELVVRQEHTEIAAIQVGLNCWPMTARIILALYQAKGRVLERAFLIEKFGISPDSNNLSVQICRARDALGSGDVIETSHSVGYRMTPKGMSAVLAALQPVEIQDERG